MDVQSIIYGLLLLLGFFWITRAVRVASDHERFAVITVGRFKELKGPGILMKLDGRATEWVRIKLGDRGKLLAPGVARFGEREIPVSAEGAVEAQRFVRVQGFEGEGAESRPVVALDADQRETIRCPRCGHDVEVE
jgi:regulator of protease activity HflC (stomatin/prohibitin superfamily)